MYWILCLIVSYVGLFCQLLVRCPHDEVYPIQLYINGLWRIGRVLRVLMFLASIKLTDIKTGKKPKHLVQATDKLYPIVYLYEHQLPYDHDHCGTCSDIRIISKITLQEISYFICFCLNYTQHQYINRATVFPLVMLVIRYISCLLGWGRQRPTAH